MTSAATSVAKRERRRRSHIRTFTGCLQCRQRHVKCDETRPTCTNCNRMGIACSAYSFIIDMQVSTPRTLEAAKKRKNASPLSIPIIRTRSQDSGESWSPISTGSSCDMLSNAPRSYTLEHHVMQAGDDGDETIPGQMILKPSLTRSETMPTRLRPYSSSPPVKRPASSHNDASGDTLQLKIAPAVPADEQFLSNFLLNVSQLLIVYDHSHNSNAYRFFFPYMAAGSEPLGDIMHALGALHLANTSSVKTDINYEVVALSRYAQSVRGLRQKLAQGGRADVADLATCLLLVFFEMMDVNGSTLKQHLLGARDIYIGLCQESGRPSKPDHDLTFALRTFLVSTLAYLDISASASSAKAPLIPGQYWQTPDGWQYNLGVPCLSGFSHGEFSEDHELYCIRRSKSALMHIQSDIGVLAENLRSRQPMSMHDIDMIYARLDSWRAQLPEIFHHLDDPTSQLYRAECVEAAMAVRCSEQATTLYLQQVTGASTDDLAAQLLVDSILTTIQSFAQDVRQLGVLWPLFIAGSATSDVYQQTFVRSRMQGMRSFGMRNVDHALEILETVWHRQRHGIRELRWFVIREELSFTLLLT